MLLCCLSRETIAEVARLETPVAKERAKSNLIPKAVMSNRKTFVGLDEPSPSPFSASNVWIVADSEKVKYKKGAFVASVF